MHSYVYWIISLSYRASSERLIWISGPEYRALERVDESFHRA